MNSSFEANLGRLCHEAFGCSAEIAGLRRLSGGANMESWFFTHGERALVLRRLPGGAGSVEGKDENLGAISLAAQAELIEAARLAGVRAPAVLARLAPRHGLGEGFVMAHIEGETLPHRILGRPEYAAAEAQLTRQCAFELARIHSLDPSMLPGELRYRTPLELVEVQERRYRALGAELPVFDFAFCWLRRHAPEPAEPVVLHGDFRMGNLLIDAQGIAAVLDWELASLGDPARDLAWLCTPSWRFGHYQHIVGGFGRLEELLEAYREESGREIAAWRLRYWLVFGSLWWGMVCLTMGQLWRSHGDRSLERAVIGRRVSEVEIDLLLLFGEELGLERERDLRWDAPAERDSSGEIRPHELLAALGEWVRGPVQAGASAHALFEARVAANALGMARRQTEWGESFARASGARLAALGLDASALCRALREGSVSPQDTAVWEHLRLCALERICIDQPAYAGFRTALERWCN